MQGLRLLASESLVSTAMLLSCMDAATSYNLVAAIKSASKLLVPMHVFTVCLNLASILSFEFGFFFFFDKSIFVFILFA